MKTSKAKKITHSERQSLTKTAQLRAAVLSALHNATAPMTTRELREVAAVLEIVPADEKGHLLHQLLHQATTSGQIIATGSQGSKRYYLPNKSLVPINGSNGTVVEEVSAPTHTLVPKARRASKVAVVPATDVGITIQRETGALRVRLGHITFTIDIE